MATRYGTWPTTTAPSVSTSPAVQRVSMVRWPDMGEDPIKQVCHYAQALKAPRIRESAARLAEQARSSGWSHEEYLAAVLSREAAARESSGAETRIRSAGFPTRKSLEEFNFDHQPALGREVIAHL